MGSKGSDKVDYRGAALAEGEMSRDNLEAQTHANRIDQYNPWGTVDYTPTQGFDTRGNPITHWKQQTTLDPQLQAALNAQMRMQNVRSNVGLNMTNSLTAQQPWANPLGAEDFDPMQDYVQNGPVTLQGLPARNFDTGSETANAEQLQRGLDFSGAPQAGGQTLDQNISMAGVPEAQRQAMQQGTGFQDPGLQRQNYDQNINFNDPGLQQQYLDPNNQFNDPGLQGQSMMQSTGFQDPGLQGRNLQTNLDYSGASGVGTAEEVRNKAEDAIYNRGSQRLDRRMEQAGNDLEIKLRGQGLQPGDESYDRAMTDFRNQETDAYQALSNEAIMGGGQEASRDFGMQMDRRGMMTGEQDRQMQMQNDALSGQFGIDAQRQAQMQQIAQQQAGFTNEARGQQFGIDANRQAQMQQIAEAQGRYGMDARTQQFGMDAQRQGQLYDQRMGQAQFGQQAQQNQFANDAQRQAQLQQIAQSEAGFGNDARSQQYQQDQDRRQSQFDMNQQQGQFRNQARQSQYDIDAARRAASIGETGMMGDYANQAAMQQYGMSSDAANRRTQNEQYRLSNMNDQRDKAVNEQLIIGRENRDRNREWVDQQNQQRQQAIDEAARFRTQGLNEVTAWMQGQQVQAPQFQQYNQAGLAQTPQLLQAAGMQGQQNAANASAQNAGWNNLMGGIGSMAGAGMMMSDRRLKKNIKRIGTKQGHAWYSFDYIWGVPSEGVMADEIPAQFRVRMGDHDMVNYGELFA